MDKDIKIELPAKVKYIIDKLQQNGYEAFAVGGCVRDTMLGRIPNDWDITTSAKPQEVKRLFSRTIDTGIEHGTVTVMENHEGFEVTTYRIDGEYEDNRHPKEVVFTPNLIEDLKRRDFTINAMAYNDERGVVDEFDGISDLENGVVRCVGNSEERFCEDALRILRAVRFAAQLGFEIDSDTAQAIRKLASTLQNISMERIQVEMDKLIMSDNPMMLKEAYELGITKWIMPEFDAMMETEQNSIYHMYNVGVHTIKVVESVKAEHYLRWAALLHDVGKPSSKSTGKDGASHFYGHGNVGVDIAVKVLKRLKFDNKTVKIVSNLVKYHDYGIKPEGVSVRKAMVKIGVDIFPYLLELKRADMNGKSDVGKKESADILQQVEELYNEILQRGDCVVMKDMAVNGRDLIDAGLKPGKEVGETLEKLFDRIIQNPELNTKEQLMKMIKK